MNRAPPDLSPAVLRIATDERFLASLYWAWGGGKLDLDALASELHAPVSAIVTAGLCFRPRTGDDLTADVNKIALYAGIEFGCLLSFVRTVDALCAFKQTSEQDRFLAAARDAPEKGGDE